MYLKVEPAGSDGGGVRERQESRTTVHRVQNWGCLGVQLLKQCSLLSATSSPASG